MIKYIEYDSIDETGQHIIPVNTLYHMNKTASGSYSPEIMKIILNMKRDPRLYYVVIRKLFKIYSVAYCKCGMFYSLWKLTSDFRPCLFIQK